MMTPFTRTTLARTLTAGLFAGTLAAAGLTFAGCDEKTESTGTSAADQLKSAADKGAKSVTSAAETVKQEGAAALDTVKKEGAAAIESAKQAAGDAWTSLRDAAVGTAQKALDSAQTKFAELKGLGEKVPAALKPTYDKTVAEIDGQFKGLGEKLSSLKSAGAETWEKLSGEFGPAVSKLTDSIGAAIKQFSPAAGPGGK